MTSEEQLEANKQFVRAHFEEFVNQKNSSVILQNMTPDFYDHDGAGGHPTDLAGDQAMMEAMYRKYPDIQVKIEEMIAEGDRVVCRNTWRGTDAQTGQPMEFHGFVLWRLRDGRIAERWATVTAPAEVVASLSEQPE